MKPGRGAIVGTVMLLAALGCQTPAPSPPGRSLEERRVEAKRAAAEQANPDWETASGAERAEAALAYLMRYAVTHDLDAPTLDGLARATANGLESAAGRPPLASSLTLTQVRDALRAGVRRLWLRPWSMTYPAMVRLGATAMMESLSDGSHYESAPRMSQEMLLAYAEETFGMLLGGLGPFPLVTGVAPDSPAARAAIQPGTQLIAVGETSTEGRSVDEVRAMFRKVRAGEVAITAVSFDTERKLVLSRESLATGGIACRVLARRVLYLRPPKFTPTTLAQMRAASVAGGDLAARIALDLRESLSSGLEDSADLANLFLGPRPFIQLVDRAGRREVRAVPDGSPLNRARLAILVGDKTLGTGEIVAAAVQDQQRGRVIGARTGGDTRSQDYVFFREAGYARITSGRALRAGGAEITGVGVTPDVQVTAAEKVLGAPEVDDQPCPGTTSGERVTDDPVVRAGVRELLGAP